MVPIPPDRRRSPAVAARAALALWAALATAPAPAQPSPATAAQLFADADLALGERLIRESRCTQCHQGKVGGDGTSIYRPGVRITSASQLRGMVEQCNTELGLGLFPEEVSAVAAVLNRDHYRFR